MTLILGDPIGRFGGGPAAVRLTKAAIENGKDGWATMATTTTWKTDSLAVNADGRVILPPGVWQIMTGLLPNTSFRVKVGSTTSTTWSNQTVDATLTTTAAGPLEFQFSAPSYASSGSGYSLTVFQR